MEKIDQSPLPRLSSLSSQVAALLREEIVARKWEDWLPGERSLTESLQISRKTLRKALAQLRREGLVETLPSQGNKIISSNLKPSHSKSASIPVVLLLTPDPLEQMRPYTSLWVNHLKTLLSENGVILRACSGQKYFSQHPGRALEKLVRQHSVSCWLLANSNKATQAWFSSRKVECVVAGSCHPDIDLPNVDLDHYALCRHAAGVLLGRGHRRVALLNELSGRAGDIESETGFIAGVQESSHSDAVALTVKHEPTPEHLCKALDRLLGQPQPPTALLVSNPIGFLTVMSYLAQRKLRVPQDISVVSRDNDLFLSALVPVPSSYECSPLYYAKKLLKLLLHGVRNEEILPRRTLILPTYKKGGTVASPNASRA